jgi:peptidoglycan/xylan/chitin deacetylase (PgdA/CDA1 family)
MNDTFSDVEKQSVKTSAGTKTYKQVIKHVYDQGHQLGSHTFSHLELAGQSATKVKSEMTRLETVFRGVIGKNPLYMRPPAGSYDTNTLNTLGGLGYKIILWDIDSNDWRYSEVSSLSKEQANYKSVIEKDSTTKPHGHIALHHDVYKKTAEKLVPWVISYIKSKKNYKFVSVAECLGNTKGSAYRTKQ